MARSVVVRARIDQKTKKDASAVLASIGLTVSDAFRLLMVRVAKEKALPFEPLNPNVATVRAMKEARRKLKTFKGVDGLMAELNAKD
jgi:DNA-damage-inducible protein J